MYTASVPEVYQFSVGFPQHIFWIVFIWKNDYLVLYGAPSKQCWLTLPRNNSRND
jgi:hypothetical protein